MTRSRSRFGWGVALIAGLAPLSALAQAPAPGTPAPATPAPAAAPVPAAPTDGGFLQKVNAIYQGRDRAVPDDQRADLVLLPKLAAMDKPPAWVTPLNAALATPRSKGWAELDAWAAGEKQRAALDAFKSVTEPGKKFVFNQGYGREAADPAIRASGLYSEVGEPAVLAAARFNYLPALTRLGCLVQVEATRLGEAKKAKDAADLVSRWVVFGRMLADREFAAEKAWGGHAMLEGFERVRDVVRTYAKDLTDAEIKVVIDGLEPKPMAMERVLLPQGDKLAGEQLIALGYVERAGPKAETFGAMMARISSTGRPLAQFGEAARWQEAASSLGTTFETVDALKGVYGDWVRRWGLAYLDPLQQQPTDYSRMDKTKFAPIETIIKGVSELFPLRQRVITEAIGTRQALAVEAFYRKNDKWPIALAAVRPAYVREIEPDPFDAKKNELHFFVPIRDQPRGERDLPKPHTITVGGAASASAAAEADAAAKAKPTIETFRALFLVAASNPAARTAPAPNINSSENYFKTNRALFAQIYGATVADFLSSPAWEQAITAKFAGQTGVADSKNILASFDLLFTELQKVNKADKASEELYAIVRSLYPKTATASSLGGVPTFTADVDDTTFVLYSAGSNQTREWAKHVGQDGADILLWPPVLSLMRDALAKQGTEPMTLAAAWDDYTPANLLPPPPALAEKKPGQPGEAQRGEAPPPGRPGKPGLPGG